MSGRPALVAVPGLVCDAEVFAPQADALAGDVGVVVPVLGEAGSIEAMADAVLAVAPPVFALLGFSLGGYVALEGAAPGAPAGHAARAGRHHGPRGAP